MGLAMSDNMQWYGHFPGGPPGAEHVGFFRRASLFLLGSLHS
jgi:hypothetical protein